VQHTIASNALIKRTLERTDIKNSTTLFSFRILSTISNFRNWTIMANFGNNSTLSLTSGTQELYMTSATQQYLTWGTEQQHLPSGTVTIISGFRNNNHLWNIWPISPTDIYVCMSIWNIILQCPLPISNTIINCLSNKYNSAAANVSRCQSRLNVVTRMLYSSLLSLSRKEFNFISHFFIREPPQFEWSAVRHSYPIAVLVTIFVKKRRWNIT